VKCLSIRQPWAWAICHLDKDVENRDWYTTHRGPVLIHAAKRLDEDQVVDDFDFIKRVTRVDPGAMPSVTIADLRSQAGGIVGVAAIADCVRSSDSPWFVGKFGFVLTERCPLPFLPWRGQLGLFDVPNDVAHGLISSAVLESARSEL
jgi:hypothetical protein